MRSIEVVLTKYIKKANKYISNTKKTRKLLIDAKGKMDLIGSEGPLDSFIKDLKLLYYALSDWYKGNYRKFPTGSALMIVATILYFINPMDIIPDIISGVGFIDDATLLAYVLKQIHSDLNKYKLWKQTK